MLEIGCGTGEFIFGLKPSRGLGVDISEKMIEMARAKNFDGNIEFKVGEIDDIGETFDYIIISDLIGYLLDIEEFFRRLEKVTHSGTKIIITSIQQTLGADIGYCF